MESIDTKYKDIRFRSRTEARWAIWFDALDIWWIYETEGYSLPVQRHPDSLVEVVRYLPDFWLPSEHLWVEIKGQAPDKSEDEKARLLTLESGFPVLLLAGQPMNPKYAPKAQPPHLMYGPGINWDDVKPRKVDLATVFGRDPKSPDWLNAFGEAMGARFEHGETPRARRRL